MSDKKNILKNDITKKTDNGSVNQLIEKKIEFFKDIIQKTILHVQKNKFLDINIINLNYKKLNKII